MIRLFGKKSWSWTSFCWHRCLLSEVAAHEESKELLIVQPRSTAEAQASEAQRLARTYSGQPCRIKLLGRSKSFVPNAANYFGSGSVQILTEKASDVKEIFINAILTGIQIRNLEAALGVRVLDRIALIVNIFAQRAQTREAKLQVELACLQLARSRLVRIMDSSGKPATFGFDGRSEIVSGRERGRGGGVQGGLGGGGQGEAEIVLHRRRIQKKATKLKLEIEAVKKTRNIQRQSRQKNSIPVVAVVGYTNAGKSTLVGKLTKQELECDDLYFKTLDPVSRRLRFSSGQVCVMSDTVGFISDLPICLFAAFRATLEEASYADIILHVIDASSQDMKRQRTEVYKTLHEIGVSQETLSLRTVEAFNKVDRFERHSGHALSARTSRNRTQLLVSSSSNCSAELVTWLDTLEQEEAGFHPQRIFISALHGHGLDKLRHDLEQIAVQCQRQ